MFSYSDFLATVRTDGLARQNRFWVNINGPVGVDRTTHILCKSVMVPGVSLSTVPTRTTGEVFETAYDRNFEPATIIFYADRGLNVRKTFEDWINVIQNRYTRSLGWYSQYTAPIIISVDNRQNQSVFQVHLIDAYPKTIGPLSLDQGMNDIMTFEVTFDYRYYDIFTLDGGGGAPRGGPGPNDSSKFAYDQFEVGRNNPSQRPTTGGITDEYAANRAELGDFGG